MTLFVIVFTSMIVLGAVIFSIYTSMNSGASKFEHWIEKILGGRHR